MPLRLLVQRWDLQALVRLDVLELTQQRGVWSENDNIDRWMNGITGF